MSLALVVAAGCSSKEQPAGSAGKANNHVPVVTSASILPNPIVLSSSLTVQVDAQDLDGQNVRFRYQWLVNGKVVQGQSDATLPPQILKRGDQVAVEVTPSDGIAEGAAFRTSASPVLNTPPVIQHASIEVDSSTGGRHLVAHVEVFDPDRDSFTVAYRWMQNENLIQEGESNRLEVNGLTAQDMIRIEITASDGAPNGVSSVSADFQTGNSPPRIVSSPPSSAGGGQFEYLVQATDSDGDPVTYALETAPPGMNIDAATGQIRWAVPADAQGAHQVRVVAQDDRGGTTAQDFELSFAPPAPASDQQTEKS
ncbi:MAG: Ig domain-containing protein [Nitrospira sp.]|nr:Ig domain-containing protein [Nitrospira sp.]